MMGLNPRDIEKAMKRMGIQQQDIDATEVVIKTPTKQLIIKNPHVAKVNAMGQESFQITGIVEEKITDSTPEITEDDIKTVMEQTNCDKKTAEETLQKNKGDLAQTIIELKE
ncbi:nascent polypeptide-associated complex protein [Candidatus Woesearchaeota archaeon]|nr:nascent polypeptide-associated complex protein [Candidatus Woesearchaeota archaeon]